MSEEKYPDEMSSTKTSLFWHSLKFDKMKQKTMTLSALVAVSKTETGMDYVQVMPDNPRVGMVEPFRGTGYGQMLSNGTFDFVHRKRVRRKPVLKLPHGSLSFGEDGMDRFIFVLPSEQREEFVKLLGKEAQEAISYLIDNWYY